MLTYDNNNVCRQDSLLDEQKALQLLKEAKYGVLSMVEDRGGSPAGYGIPINFVWDGDRSIYFHCALAGHKLGCLDVNPKVSFYIVGRTQVLPHLFSTAYECVLVQGVLTRELPVAERMDALALLLDKYCPNDKEAGMRYTEKTDHRTEVLCLEIQNVSGKTKHVGY